MSHLLGTQFSQTVELLLELGNLLLLDFHAQLFLLLA
jgi:hypothetical protein